MLATPPEKALAVLMQQAVFAAGQQEPAGDQAEGRQLQPDSSIGALGPGPVPHHERIGGATELDESALPWLGPSSCRLSLVGGELGQQLGHGLALELQLTRELEGAT